MCQSRIKQIFVASHSSVVLNEFLNIGAFASIYEFGTTTLRTEQESNQKLLPNNTSVLFTTVKKIDSEYHSVLNNLGCNGADLLQANGIIWVEGPSDIVYIKKWLEMYEREKSKSYKFIQGKEFEFKPFAGTLLNNYYLNKNSCEGDLKKLVNIFSFSRNAFVIIDSDAVKKNGKTIDKSKFREAKRFIKEEFEIMETCNLGLWYKEGNTDIRTLESYLDEVPPAGRKLDYAIKQTQSWGSEKKLHEFKNNLYREIEILYNIIEEWNK